MEALKKSLAQGEGSAEGSRKKLAQAAEERKGSAPKRKAAGGRG
jgi:hypothetical protein